MSDKLTFRKAWKKFWEPILGFGFFQWVIAVFMAIPIWFSYFTSIKKITNIEVFYKYRKKPAIFVCLRLGLGRIKEGRKGDDGFLSRLHGNIQVCVSTTRS